MRRIEIKSSEDERFEKFRRLYGSSFPIFEQRTSGQQEYAFRCSQYHLCEYLDGDIFVGFISYWEFDRQIYIELLAVDTTLRGKGYGSRMLDSFVASTPKTVILEIDPDEYEEFSRNLKEIVMNEPFPGCGTAIFAPQRP